MENCNGNDPLAVGAASLSRRKILRLASGLPLLWLSLSAAGRSFGETIDDIPTDLDEPTAWREGDPEPLQLSVPAIEPEQTSNEAPPSRPINDDRGEAPGPDYRWVYGYWWWSDRRYIWVPGYWAPRYIYIPGRWNYRSNVWFYIRGGWGYSNAISVDLYAAPRPYRRVFVLPAPYRIARRNYRWPYYPARSRRFYSHQSLHKNLRPGNNAAKGDGRKGAPRRER